MSRAKIIDHYLKKIKEEGFDVYQVRKELQKNNVDEEEIKIIVRLVDNEVQRTISRKSDNDSVKPLVLIGLILILIGAGITIATHTGLLNMGKSFLIVYGPFLGGISLLVTGLAKSRK